MRLIIDSNMAKMPHNCHECYLGYGGWCAVMPAEIDEPCPDTDRPEWCPLSEYKEPKRGRWIVEDSRFACQMVLCSECGNGSLRGLTRYCPNCGSMMVTGT